MASPGRALATDAGGSAFGERLRRFRVAARLSQEALAERSELSVQAIDALETGKRRRPYPPTMSALADALAVTERERAELAEARDHAAPPAAIAQSSPPRWRAPLIGRNETIFERAEQRARAALGPRAYAAAEAAGWALPRERAVSEAFALADEIAGNSSRALMDLSARRDARETRYVGLE